MKATLTLTIAIMAVLMIAAFAVPLASAEDATDTTSDATDDSSAAIDLYDDTSNLPEGVVISPAPESTDTEQSLELDESVSGGKIAWRQFKLWFTFNQERRIEGELELAKLRLIQAKIAAKNGDSEAVEKAIEAHERIMNRIQERMGKLESASDSKGLGDSADKLVGLEKAIQVHERRIAYLGKVLDTADLTDAQRAKIETKLAKMEENVGDLTALQERKMEKIKTKLMAVRGLTEEEADLLIAEKQEAVRDRVRDRISERTADNSGNTEEVQTETEAEESNEGTSTDSGNQQSGSGNSAN